METDPLRTWFLKRYITSFGQFIFPWLPFHELAHKNKHCKQERRTRSYVLATCRTQYQLSFLKSHCCSLELFHGKPSFEKKKKKYLLQGWLSVECGSWRERRWRSKWAEVWSRLLNLQVKINIKTIWKVNVRDRKCCKVKAAHHHSKKQTLK